MVRSFQDTLDDAQFEQKVKHFKKVTLDDLRDPDFPKGGMMRYTVDRYDKRGRFLERKYRLGGFLTHVDSGLRYVMLRNPMVRPDPRAPQLRQAWSVQLQPEDAVVTLYYKERLGSQLDDQLRGLLAKIESGEFKLTKVRGRSHSRSASPKRSTSRGRAR